MLALVRQEMLLLPGVDPGGRVLVRDALPNPNTPTHTFSFEETKAFSFLLHLINTFGEKSNARERKKRCAHV